MVSGLNTPCCYWYMLGFVESKYILFRLHDAPILRGVIAIYPINASNFVYIGGLETISFKYLTSLALISE